MKKVFWFLLTIILIQSVFAMSVSPGKVSMIFDQNYKTTTSLSIGGFGGDVSSLAKYLAEGGELQKAFTLGEFKEAGEDKATLQISIDFSKVDIKNVTPGNNRVLVGVSESAPDEAQFAALVAIRVPFNIFVPFEGIFFQADLEASDVELGEEGTIKAIVKNLGGQKIKLAPVLTIMQGESEKARFEIKEFEMDTNEEKTITRTFDSIELGEGQFVLKFAAQVGEFKVERTADFRIGKWELEVAFVNQAYQANKDIEQFVMQVANKWNEEAKNVNAEVTISNSSGKVIDFKTANFDVPASETNQTKEVKQFFEAAGICAGKYNMNVTLYFNNNTFSSMHEVEFKEKSGLAVVWIILGVAIALIIVVGIIFLLLRKTKHKSKHRRQ